MIELENDTESLLVIMRSVLVRYMGGIFSPTINYIYNNNTISCTKHYIIIVVCNIHVHVQVQDMNTHLELQTFLPCLHDRHCLGCQSLCHHLRSRAPHASRLFHTVSRFPRLDEIGWTCIHLARGRGIRRTGQSYHYGPN